MLLHLAALAATVLILSRVVPGVHIRSPLTAVTVAAVFSVLNFFLGWFIRALLILPGILTLGLLFFFLSFIVNTALLWLTDKLMKSFEIGTTRSLLVSSAAITLVNSFCHVLSTWSDHAWRSVHVGGPNWV